MLLLLPISVIGYLCVVYGLVYFADSLPVHGVCFAYPGQSTMVVFAYLGFVGVVLHVQGHATQCADHAVVCYIRLLAQSRLIHVQVH